MLAHRQAIDVGDGRPQPRTVGHFCEVPVVRARRRARLVKTSLASQIRTSLLSLPVSNTTSLQVNSSGAQ